MASVAKAHAACKALPGATYDVKWGKDECYSVGGKMFAVIGPGGTYGASPRTGRSIGFKVDDFRFLEPTDREGIIPATHKANQKWVMGQDKKKHPGGKRKVLIPRSHALEKENQPSKARRKAEPFSPR